MAALNRILATMLAMTMLATFGWYIGVLDHLHSHKHTKDQPAALYCNLPTWRMLG